MTHSAAGRFRLGKLSRSIRAIGAAALPLALAGSFGSAFAAQTVQDNSGVTALKPGVYDITTTGQNGFMKFEVTLGERSIDAIRVTESAETPWIADEPVKRIIGDILARQSLAIDAVSGATRATQAVLRAAGEAIEKAGGRSVEWAPDPVVIDPAKLPAGETAQADVVVVGAGASGLAAAAAAIESGARVIVVDKADAVGGSAARSAGLIAAASETNGAHDAEGLLAQWTSDQKRSVGAGLSKNLPDAERLGALVKKSAGTVAWLEKNFGLAFSAGGAGSQGVALWALAPSDAAGTGPCAGRAGGDLETCRMAQFVTERGGRILTATAVSKLLRDEAGAVTGVEASDGRTRITLKSKSVILASGGFGADLIALAERTPRWAVYAGQSLAAPASTGDGIALARSAGGREDSDFWIASTSLAPAYPAITPAMLGPNGWAGVTLVNERGARFVREDLPDVANAAAEQRDVWLIADSADKNKAEVLDRHFAYGIVVSGESWEELGRRMGVKAERFAQEMRRMSEAAGTGEDKAFGRDMKTFSPLAQAPYYAVLVKPVISGTIGGVATDDSGRVTDRSGKPVKGLYAAGELANRPYYGRVYEPGTGLLVAFSTGRTAGESAAREALAAK